MAKKVVVNVMTEMVAVNVMAEMVAVNVMAKKVVVVGMKQWRGCQVMHGDKLLLFISW